MAELSLKLRLGVAAAALAITPLMCLEKTTGEAKALDERFTAGEPTGALVVEHGSGDAPAEPFEDLDPDEGVLLSGLVQTPLDEPIDIDLMTPDSTVEGGWAPRGKILLEGPGELSLRVPKDLGILVIQAFQDLDGNGPSANDYFVGVTLEIADEDLPLTLEMVEGGYADFTLSGASSTTAFPEHEGEWTVLSGTLASPVEGTVAVDFLGPDPAAPSGTKFVAKTQLEPGPYELAIPQNSGTLTLQFFQDQAGDGPDGTDPFAQVELEVAEQEAIELDVNLEPGGYASPAQGGGASPGPSQAIFEDLGDTPITVSGEVVLSNIAPQQVALDVYRVDAGGHGGRSFLKKLYINPGPFTFQAPAGYGELILEAAIDADNDGPTPGDPFGQCDQNPVRIGDVDVDGLTITVSG